MCVLTRLKKKKKEKKHLLLMFEPRSHLSRVERSNVFPLHDEHVDKVDEDAGSLAGVSGAVR